MFDRPQRTEADQPVSREEFREQGRQAREAREREAEENRERQKEAKARKAYELAGGDPERFDYDEVKELERRRAVEEAAASDQAARREHGRIYR